MNRNSNSMLWMPSDLMCFSSPSRNLCAAVGIFCSSKYSASGGFFMISADSVSYSVKLSGWRLSDF